MSKLDRSKPFAEVWGDHPARFEQDGKLFNAAEDEIEVETVWVEGEDGKKTRVTRLKATSSSAEKATKPASKATSSSAEKATKPASKATSSSAEKPEQPAPAPAADDVEDQLAAQLGEGDGSFE